MLEMLDIRDGRRVLEIGTGTGYNAALLCHRLGDDRVFSVDIDPELIALARQRLADAGFRPTVVAVDGERGLPEHAPYDRIIATCAVPAVPASWTRQLAPGGALLVDLKLAVSAGNLVHLHRKDNGTLEGRFAAKWGSFMTMRHNGEAGNPLPATHHTEAERSFGTSAPVPPWENRVMWFLAQLVGLPRDVVFGALLDEATRRPYAHTLTAPDGSWSRVDIADNTVTEGGTTSLWQPVESAYRLWRDNDEPTWSRLGLTVDTEGVNTVWLDDPDGEHRWSIG